MRLAFTHPYSWPEVRRGAERIVVESARALSQRGHAVTVFTAGAEAGRIRDGNVTTVRFRRRFADPGRHETWFAFRVIPELAGGRFDAVHAMMPKDALAAICTRPAAGHTVVYEELGNPWRWWWAGLRDGWVRRQLVHRVDVYGCMSNYTLDVLASEWERTGDLIPGGVRLSEFSSDGRRAEDPTILFSGAIAEPRKGLSDLLAALDLLVDEMPTVRLWLSGPGDPTPMLSSAAPRVLDRVEHLPLGDATDQGARYRAAWVTSLPSVGDSFGMALIESLASGTPIVVADDGAPPQLVTPQTGVVVRPHDPASLAEGLRQGLALSQKPETRQHCRSFAAQFDWDTSIAALLEDLYRRPPRGGRR